jgi:hypothetical protein
MLVKVFRRIKITQSLMLVVLFFFANFPLKVEALVNQHKEKQPIIDKQQVELTERLIQSTQDYKASIEKLIGFHQQDIEKQTEKLKKRQELYKAGIIARRELEEVEAELNNTRNKLTNLEKELAEADNLLVEAEAAKDLALNPPLPNAPSYRVSAGIIRYSGFTQWSLQDSPVVQKFFQNRFGKGLPITAYGQSPTHDRLGFDHRNCMDVGVNPESEEGQALISFLRSSGIPFQAFDRAIAGSSTGPHIHIGKPSARISITK